MALINVCVHRPRNGNLKKNVIKKERCSM